MITYPCRYICGRAAVDGGVFPKGIMVADEQSCRLTDIFEILGDLPDSGEGEKGVVFTDRRVTLDHHVRFEYAASTDVNVGTDDTVWTYRDPIS